MLIVHLVVAGIFLVLGTVFAFGKGAFLIAGYNTASAEEKAQYDEKKLCRGCVEAYVCAGGVLGRGGAQRNLQKHDFSVGRHSSVCGCDCRRSRLD